MVELRNQSYLNTLIFTIIAEGITVLVIGLLAIPPIRAFTPFLLTLEIGMIIVILWTIYAINRYHKVMAKQFKVLKNTFVSNVPCPDYYVRDSDDDGNLVCKNDYTSPNGRLKINLFQMAMIHQQMNQLMKLKLMKFSQIVHYKMYVKKNLVAKAYMLKFRGRA